MRSNLSFLPEEDAIVHVHVLISVPLFLGPVKTTLQPKPSEKLETYVKIFQIMIIQ